MMPFMAPMMMGQAVGGLETVQSLPPMTGPSAPSGYAALSNSEYLDGSGNKLYPAYLSFDGTSSPDGKSWISRELNIVPLPVFVRRDMPSPKKIGAYAMWSRASNGLDQMPRAWTFQGSNDGSNWTDLHSASSQTWSVFGERRYFSIAEARRAEYSKYRWFISENNGANFLTAQELELLFVV